MMYILANRLSTLSWEKQGVCHESSSSQAEESYMSKNIIM